MKQVLEEITGISMEHLQEQIDFLNEKGGRIVQILEYDFRAYPRMLVLVEYEKEVIYNEV